MNKRRLVLFAVATVIPLSAQIQGITGAPYTATQTTERIQTLADGTRITQPGQKIVIYRDSAGRMRTDTILRNADPLGINEPLPTEVTIVDPVAGFRYQFNLKDRVIQRYAIQAPRPATAQPRPLVNPQGIAVSAVGGIGSRNPRNVTNESLGTQMIEGVTAEGTRTTTTFAVGTIGNDREIVVANEMWFSKQLGVVVLRKSSDPRTGDVTTKLTNISLVEPDAALFVPPPDYTVRDSGGPPGAP